MIHYHTTESRVLEERLKTNKDLRIAHKLKEQYHHFNDIEELKYEETKTEGYFASIIEAMEASEIEEFIECSKTLKNWKAEILNSITWIGGRRISNGPIEGKNNYLKKIINNANGLKN